MHREGGGRQRCRLFPSWFARDCRPDASRLSHSAASTVVQWGLPGISPHVGSGGTFGREKNEKRNGRDGSRRAIRSPVASPPLPSKLPFLARTGNVRNGLRLALILAPDRHPEYRGDEQRPRLRVQQRPGHPRLLVRLIQLASNRILWPTLIGDWPLAARHVWLRTHASFGIWTWPSI